MSDILYNNIICDISSRARDIKERINKWDYVKLKGFCMTKENISNIKREPTTWENLFANDTSVKHLISKIHKEHIQLNPRKTKKSN